MSKANRKVEVGLATKATLIKTARELFAAGYDSVGTPAIADAAGVTRGALYHHFPDKRALFAAVVEVTAKELVDRIEAASSVHDNDPVSAVLAGCKEFISACQDEETRQVFLVDAPAVLGWSNWREIDARHGLGSLKTGLQACAAAGYIATDEVETAAYLISGALNEVTFAFAHASENTLHEDTLDRGIERLVRSLLNDCPNQRV